MRFFTCLLDPGGRGISDVMRRGYETLPRTRGLGFEWKSAGQIEVLTGWDDPYGDPLVAQHETGVAVGIVRLDNRAELRRWAGCECEGLTDLEVVLRIVERHGSRYVPQVLGDFAFVVWDGGTRKVVAACDAFAVRRLYYAERDGLVVFASRGEALAREERYDVQYLVELLARHSPSHHVSVYADVRPVPAASIAVLERGRVRVRQYWNAADFDVEEAWARSEHEAAETCRRLLAESIQLRLGGPGDTWAQLSGGLDSSSVVSLAQWLAERGEITEGLAGTVTYVDRQATGADERAYSDAVVNRWRVRNEMIIDAPSWHDDQYGLPRTDQPTFDLQVYPRERRVCAAVQAAGGRVLLTGWGGDELFMGSMLFFADWVVQGRVLAAVREMASRAAIGRVSFWELAYKNALLPLLPRAAQCRLAHDDPWSPPVQPWLNRRKLQQYGLTARSPLAPEYAGRLGHKYHHAVATKIATLSAVTDRGVLGDSLELRHPLLYRPLVEFAVRLPPNLRARPHAHRWVLREAMRGILPESVRTRVGKQDTGDALAWSLTVERARLALLLQDPILAELGIVDAAKLRAVFDAAPHQSGRGNYVHGALLSTLTVEAWLQMRSGRWPRGAHLSSTDSQVQVHGPSA
jgi:asparagine synthase (glutamine-hydrolysing)